MYSFKTSDKKKISLIINNENSNPFCPQRGELVILNPKLLVSRALGWPPLRNYWQWDGQGLLEGCDSALSFINGNKASLKHYGKCAEDLWKHSREKNLGIGIVTESIMTEWFAYKSPGVGWSVRRFSDSSESWCNNFLNKQQASFKDSFGFAFRRETKIIWINDGGNRTTRTSSFVYPNPPTKGKVTARFFSNSLLEGYDRDDILRAGESEYRVEPVFVPVRLLRPGNDLVGIDHDSLGFQNAS